MNVFVKCTVRSSNACETVTKAHESVDCVHPWNGVSMHAHSHSFKCKGPVRSSSHNKSTPCLLAFMRCLRCNTQHEHALSAPN